MVGGSTCFLDLLTATTTMLLLCGFSSPLIIILFLSLYYLINSLRLFLLSYHASGLVAESLFDFDARKSYLAGPISVLTLILVAVVPTLELLLADYEGINYPS